MNVTFDALPGNATSREKAIDCDEVLPLPTRGTFSSSVLQSYTSQEVWGGVSGLKFIQFYR